MKINNIYMYIILGNKIEAAPPSAHHPRLRRQAVHVPSERSRGSAAGRASDAAVWTCQYSAAGILPYKLFLGLAQSHQNVFNI